MSADNFAPSIIDNTPSRKLAEVIKDQLKKSKEAKFAIGYFFLSGFSLLKDDFPESYDQSPFLRIVMGDETTYPTKIELAEGYKLREIFKQRMIEELQKVSLTEEQIDRLRNLKDFIARNIIDVKLYEESRLHAKLYLFLTGPEEKYSSPGLAIVGSSNFTSEGLTKNRELNVLLTSREEVIYLNSWFEELWDEAVDFREDLLKIIDFSGVLPESPYPKIGTLIDPITLFKYLVYKWTDGRILNLSKKDILMEFQVIGVLNAINIIGTEENGYNGVILADSVGLGKSFMASAIIEEFLYRKHPSWIYNGKEPGVLLILPPSIIPQWEELLIGRIDKEMVENLVSGKKVEVESESFLRNTYKRLIKNENSNRIYEIYNETGELLGKINFLSLGILQNYKVDDTEQNLKNLAEEYDLIVIDEAHKYRNKNTNRWKAVRKLQKKEDNFPNRFILLTATPLNNSIYDIFNIIRLFIDDSFAPFSIRGVNVRDLISRYNNLKKELKAGGDDEKKRELQLITTEIKHKLLDEIMVLRTRKYIKEQFKDLKVNGKPLVFKDPKPYILDYSPFYTKEYLNLVELILEKLNEISFEHTKLYGTSFVVFEEETIDEEGNKYRVEIADLFKLLLGKRLESGIYPFETTLRRIYEKEKIFYKLFKSRMKSIITSEDLRHILEEAINQAKINIELEELEGEYSVEEEKEKTWFDRVVELLIRYGEEMREPGKEYPNIELLKLGLEKALKNLETDLRIIDELLDKLDNLKEKENGTFKILYKLPNREDGIISLDIWSYRNDPKLESLQQLIGDPSSKSERLKEVPSLNNKKILIFTQYQDTAYYLYHNLLNWIERETGLHRWLKKDTISGSDNFKIGLVTGETDTPVKINYIKRFAPEANNGWEEIDKFGEIEILIATDALSEGLNLQDADAVVNYDLPWNPMIIVQRVGRVSRIGNDKDVTVINYTPSDEIEILVGILSRLKEKIKDITLVVGKENKILSPEEEITVETFGEKIKDISKLTMTELEQYGISEDFKEFIAEGMTQEQLDEYRLLNAIQYDIGYTYEDFKEIENMKDGPYYTFISSNTEKLISIYEFYRGKYKIMKKITSRDSGTGEIKSETPLIFLDLIKKRSKGPEKIETVIENLSLIKEENDRVMEELRENYQLEQKGFLYNLYNALIVNREKAEGIQDKFRIVINAIQAIPYYLYSREIKSMLTQKGLIEIERDNIVIKDFGRTIETLLDFLIREKGITDIESLKIRVNNIGWYYEV